uniref:VP3 n=1 Tax=Zoersel tick virus TaxID=2867438 RepID=A0A8G0QEG4_9REOV|nr:VP3 [Zoersel tick virus]
MREIIRRLQGDSIGENEILNLLSEYQDQSSIYERLQRLVDLKRSLLESGYNYLKCKSDSVDYGDQTFVSNLMASYWIEKVLSSSEVLSNNDFWECACFDGTMDGLKELMKNEILSRSGLLSSGIDSGLIIYPPRKIYYIIRNKPLFSNLPIRFQDYIITFLPYVHSIDELTSRCDDRKWTIIHVLPHYGVYHRHECIDENEFIMYLAWSVYRSQQEKNSFRNSIKLTNNLRFTRGGLISRHSSDFSKFLNFLLFNSLYLNLSLNAVNYDEWYAYLTFLFNRQDLMSNNDGVSRYSLNGMYLVPASLKVYISAVRHQVVQSHVDRCVLEFLLDGYLSVISVNDIIVNEDKRVGRVSEKLISRKGVNIKTLCLGRVLFLSKYPKMSFNVRASLTPTTFSPLVSNFNMMGRVMLGLPSTRRLIYNPLEVNYLIDYVRRINPIRALISEIKGRMNLHRYWKDSLYTQVIKKELHVNLGVALIACVLGSKTGEFEFQGCEDGHNVENRYSFVVRGYDPQSSSFINRSTPKLASAIEMSYRCMEYSNPQNEYEPLAYFRLKHLFSKMLIFGSVGDGDPIGIGFKKIFKSQITEVGALGTGTTIRSTCQEFEYSQGYRAVISDMDQTYTNDYNQVLTLFRDTLIKCVNTIQPDYLLWKVNYCGLAMRKMLLLLLEDEVNEIEMYYVGFLEPEFHKICNSEMYLMLYRGAEPIVREHFGLSNLRDDSLSERDASWEFNKEMTLIANLDQYLGVAGILPFSAVHNFVDLNDSEAEYVIPILLKNCANLELSRVMGTNRILGLSSFSLKRIFLTNRVNVVYQLLSEEVNILDLDTLQPKVQDLSIRYSQRKLGDYIRELWRVAIRYEVIGTYNLKYSLEVRDNFHYIGVGDERGRNVECVPIRSPYTIIDPRVPEELRKFNINTLSELFPYDVEDATLLTTRLYHEYGKPLVMFFLFMLYNDNPPSNTLLRRIELLSLLVGGLQFVNRIYFNVYIIDSIIDSFDLLDFNNLGTIFQDISLLKSQDVNNPEEINYYATFSTNYDPVELVTNDEVLNAGSGPGVRCRPVPLTIQQLYNYVWIDKTIPNEEAMGGIECGLSFSQVYCVERE